MSDNPDIDGGGNAQSVAAESLRSFTERVERLEEEKAEIQEQIKSVFAEAKAQGFDVKAMREVLKLRKMKPHERAEREALREQYGHALGVFG